MEQDQQLPTEESEAPRTPWHIGQALAGTVTPSHSQ